jgi:hypothetical protein
MVIDHHGGEPGHRVRRRRWSALDDCGHRSSSCSAAMMLGLGLGISLAGRFVGAAQGFL